MIGETIRRIARDWVGTMTSKRLTRLLEKAINAEIDARGLQGRPSRCGVSLHPGGRPRITGGRGRRHALDMHPTETLRADRIEERAHQVVDAMIPVLRSWAALEALSHLGPEIRTRDGGTRRLPLQELPGCVWRAHPAIVNLAAMIGIDPANLVEGKEDRGRSTIDHTTRWPERSYWRIDHKAAARDDAMPSRRQFDVHHVLKAQDRGSGLRRIESSAEGVSLDVLVGGIIPDTLLAAMVNAGLPALVSNWRELPHASCRGEIMDVQDATTWRQRGSQRLYRFTLADEPYVGIEPMPDGVDTTWMDPTWGMARGS